MERCGENVNKFASNWKNLTFHISKVKADREFLKYFPCQKFCECTLIIKCPILVGIWDYYCVLIFVI